MRKDKIVQANGVALCIETFGDSTNAAILLIAGAGSSMLSWDGEFCERLAAGSRFVIRFDNRDTGRSVSYEPGAPPYTLRDLVADAVGLLDALGLARAHLVGSPEQARGRPVDKRADIWAFGCVLYEMLAGRRVFAGDSVTDTLAKVIEREPDWTALPADTPAHVRGVIERCLRKDPSRRLRDIGDARLQLEEGPNVRGRRAAGAGAARGVATAHRDRRGDGRGHRCGLARPATTAGNSRRCQIRAVGPAHPHRVRAVHAIEREAGHRAGWLEGRVRRRRRGLTPGLRARARRTGVGATARH